MIIVARRISVGELFEIGRVAVVDVVETHRGRSFAGGLLGEARRLRLAVGACADRGLDPGEEVGGATGSVPSSCRAGVAIEPLIHLKETVYGARVISVIRILRRGDLEGARPKMA